ncbi:MAG: hypothetical protein U1E56_08945 [Bauldia sp.]
MDDRLTEDRARNTESLIYGTKPTSPASTDPATSYERDSAAGRRPDAPPPHRTGASDVFAYVVFGVILLGLVYLLLQGLWPADRPSLPGADTTVTGTPQTTISPPSRPAEVPAAPVPVAPTPNP